MATSDDFYCGLLSLPTELRCHIYDYLLSDSQAITISAGKVTTSGARCTHVKRNTSIPGLPHDLAPIARPHYDASLLYVVKAPEIEHGDEWPSYTGDKAGQLPMPAPLALRLTCRAVSDEFKDYERGRRRVKTARAPAKQQDATKKQTIEHGTHETSTEGLSLYVSYPYGVLVLKTLYPHLLKYASRVFVSGYYLAPQASRKGSPESPFSGSGSDEERLTPTNSFGSTSSFGTTSSFGSNASFGTQLPSIASLRRRSTHEFWNSNILPPISTVPNSVSITTQQARPRLRLDIERTTAPPLSFFPALSSQTHTVAPKTLALLIRTIFPDGPTNTTTFSARILYPGADSYTRVFSDDASPSPQILRNVCGGKIQMRILRGRDVTGLVFTATPLNNQRVVSTNWENWTPGRRIQRQTSEELDRFFVFA